MSDDSYAIRQAGLALLIYYLYLYRFNIDWTIDGWSFMHSTYLLLALIEVSVISGFWTVGRAWRNHWFLLFHTLAPFGIYTAIAFAKDYPVLILVLFSAAMVLSLIYALLVLLRKIRSERRHRRIVRSRIQKVYGVGRLMFGLAAMIAITVIVLDSNDYHTTMKAAAEATKEDELSADMVMEVSEDLLLLGTEEWDTLSNQEKLDILQKIANLEQAYLGIPHAVTVGASELEETTFGCYNDTKQSITINLEWLDILDSWSVVETVCHEMYHAYQYCLVDIYNTLPEETKRLYMFKIIPYYEYEFANYIEGAEDPEAYAKQYCEKGAREYAYNRMVVYYALITELLGGTEEETD